MMMQRFLLRQYQKVYRYDNWLRQRFTVTGQLFIVVMVAAGVFGVDTKHSNTYQLFAFLLVILIFAALNSRFNRLKLQIKRQLPRYGTVGEPLNYSVILTNLTGNHYSDLAFVEQLAENFPNYAQLKRFFHTDKPSLLKRGISFNQWRHYLAYQRGGTIAETPIAELGKKPATIAVHFTPLRRGKLTFAASYIAKPDLFGLYRRLIPVTEPQSCLVLPKRYQMKPLLFAGKRKYQAGGVSLANSIGNSSEFMALRDYQHGDPLNKIHWKSFAKHGNLTVKDYQDEYFVRRALLLDTFMADAQPELFEAAVSVAASLALVEQENEALLDLMFVGDQTYCFTSGRGVNHLPHLQEILASVQSCETDNFLQLQHAVLHRVGQCSSFVCVLMRWDESRQNLIKSLTVHGLPVAVFVLHNGSLTQEQCPNKPEFFYLLRQQNLAAQLAAI